MHRVLLGVCAAALVAGCQTTAEAPAAPVEPIAVVVSAFDPVAAEAEAFLTELNVTPASPAQVNADCDEVFRRATDLRTRLETETGPATVAQTFRRYDALSGLVYGGGSEAYLVSQVHPDEAIRMAAEECVKRLDELSTQIGLSRPIYERLSAIDASAADERTRFALSEQLADYRRAGVDKDAATRARIEALQKEITAIGLTFNRNIREGRREITVKSVEELAGLPADYIERHPPGPDGLIRITTEYPDYQPVMAYAHSEDLRRRLSAEYDDRAWPANEPVLKELLEKRYELARILGYETWAHLATEDKMIGTPERAAAFIDEIAAAAAPAAERDYARLLARLRQIDPDATEVPRWSSAYLSQLVKKEQYDVDPQAVRQYFAFDDVQAGIIQLTEELFDVDIRPWAAPVWHESVGAYEMYDGDELIGRFFLDMHPRDGKYSHAAHFQPRIGLADRVIPVGALVTNFPAGDHATGLMEHRQVETYLHEFGHLLHNIFSGRQEWAVQTYHTVERDFIEAPSQLLEEWIWDYDTLSRFAVNAQGQTIPAELVEKMNAARNFGEALGDRVQLGYAAVSLNYYNRPASAVELHPLYEAMYEKYALYELPETSHPYAAFSHLDGYSAVYYTYTWSKAIGADLFTPFEGNMRDTALARRYRDIVLAQGGSKPAAVLVEEFLGRPWTLDAYREQLLKE